MQQLRRCWYYILGEPFGWLFCYFFNTDKFFHTFEMRNSAIRLKLLSRLILPMFFVSYPLAVLLFNLYTLPHFNFSWINMFLVTVVGTLSGIAIGIAWDIMVNMPLGILSGMWFGMWLGMWSGISWVSWIGVLLTTIGGILLGTGIVQEVSKIVIKNREGSAQYLIDFNWWS